MTLADVLTALDGKSNLTADDALSLRAVIYGPSLTVTPAEADVLFKLNADAGTLSSEWSALFIEVMTDFIVRQATPVGYVDDEKADWLITSVSRSGRIRKDEVEMLLYVLEQADQTPPRLSTFVLNTVQALTLWALQTHGRLTQIDVERVRRAIFAKGGAANTQVTRAEAEALFDINDALKGASTDGWRDLFVRAVANAVLFETPWKPDVAEELRCEAFENDPSVEMFSLARAEYKKGRFFRDMLGAFPDMLQGGLEHNMAELDAHVTADEALEARAECVTADEAHWLLSRIGKDGDFDANEHALIDFIRSNARTMDRSFNTLLNELEQRLQGSPKSSASTNFIPLAVASGRSQ